MSMLIATATAWRSHINDTVAEARPGIRVDVRRITVVLLKYAGLFSPT